MNDLTRASIGMREHIRQLRETFGDAIAWSIVESAVEHNIDSSENYVIHKVSKSMLSAITRVKKQEELS